MIIMFDCFLRLVFRLEKLTYNEYDYALLLKDRGKANYLSSLLCFTMWVFPIAMLGAALVAFSEPANERLTLFVMFVAYLLFSFWFIKKFKRPIKIFEKSVEDSLYASKHTLRGNAISKEDFTVLAEKDIHLYRFITSEACRGNCYHVCYEIMQNLEKGSFLLAAVHRTSSDDIKNKYTMHALYVNNNWCFDTYTQKQLPLKKALELFRGKTYKVYSYEDSKGKSIQEFRDEIYPALKKWCDKNDCFVQMYANEP